MEKRILKGGTFISSPALGALLVIPMIGGSLISIKEYLWGGLLIAIYILILMIREKVVLDYKNNTITFYIGFYTRVYKSNQFQRSKIKNDTKSYDISSGKVMPVARGYSVTKKALYIANIVNKEEKLIKIGDKEELEIIAKELETNFGVVRV